jgi:hypothetical protein
LIFALRPHLKKCWTIPPAANGEFVDPAVPVVRMDEKPYQLLDHARDRHWASRRDVAGTWPALTGWVVSAGRGGWDASFGGFCPVRMNLLLVVICAGQGGDQLARELTLSCVLGEVTVKQDHSADGRRSG